MKIFNAILVFLAIPFRLLSCPTCVGKIKAESPPFFSDDFYQPNKSETQTMSKEQIGHTQFKKLIENKRVKK